MASDALIRQRPLRISHVTAEHRTTSQTTRQPQHPKKIKKTKTNSPRTAHLVNLDTLDGLRAVVQRPRHGRPFAGLTATNGTTHPSPFTNVDGQPNGQPPRLTPFGIRVAHRLRANWQLANAPAPMKPPNHASCPPSRHGIHADAFSWRPAMKTPTTRPLALRLPKDDSVTRFPSRRIERPPIATRLPEARGAPISNRSTSGPSTDDGRNRANGVPAPSSDASVLPRKTKCPPIDTHHGLVGQGATPPPRVVTPSHENGHSAARELAGYVMGVPPTTRCTAGRTTSTNNPLAVTTPAPPSEQPRKTAHMAVTRWRRKPDCLKRTSPKRRVYTITARLRTLRLRAADIPPQTHASPCQRHPHRRPLLATSNLRKGDAARARRDAADRALERIVLQHQKKGLHLHDKGDAPRARPIKGDSSRARRTTADLQLAAIVWQQQRKGLGEFQPIQQHMSRMCPPPFDNNHARLTIGKPFGPCGP